MKQQLTTIALATFLLAPGCRKTATDPAVARVNGKPILASELAGVLPPQLDPNDTTVRRRVLDQLIDKELMAQGATAEGLEDSIAQQLEVGEKRVVVGEFINRAGVPPDSLGEPEMEEAYRLLCSQARIRLVEVETESLAQRLMAELKAGVPMETLAVRYSIHPTAASGGDLGLVPELFIDLPMRDDVLVMKPGETRGPLEVYGRYRIVRLEGRQPTQPPVPPLDSFRQRLKDRLLGFLSYDRTARYLAGQRSHLEWNQAGSDILFKPADSITEPERHVPVVSRGGTPLVEVGELLPAIRQLPARLDSAAFARVLRREVDSELLYRAALAEKLEQLPAVRERVRQMRRDLLAGAYYRHEVGPLRRQADADGGRGIQARLRAKADIKVDEQVLRGVTPAGGRPGSPARPPRG